MFTQTEITKKGIMLEIPKEDIPYSHKLLAYLKSLIFSAQALPISYRVLNHWEKTGLIKSYKREGSKWRRFTFFETVWIYMLNELRQFGYPLNKALETRAMLFGSPTTKNVSYEEADNEHTLQFMFELECIRALLKRQISYAIDVDGYPSTLYTNDFSSVKIDKPILIISLNAIIEKLFVDCKMDPSFSPVLTKEERKIIFLLRENKYKEVKISYKNNKPDVFYGEQVLENYKRIAEIMKEHMYQDIAITETDGKISHMKRTVKRKITD